MESLGWTLDTPPEWSEVSECGPPEGWRGDMWRRRRSFHQGWYHRKEAAEDRHQDGLEAPEEGQEGADARVISKN